MNVELINDLIELLVNSSFIFQAKISELPKDIRTPEDELYEEQLLNEDRIFTVKKFMTKEEILKAEYLYAEWLVS